MEYEDLGHKNGMAHLSNSELLEISENNAGRISSEEEPGKNNLPKINPKERYEQKNKTKKQEKQKRLPPVGKLSPDDGGTYRFL